MDNDTQEVTHDEVDPAPAPTLAAKRVYGQEEENLPITEEDYLNVTASNPTGK